MVIFDKTDGKSTSFFLYGQIFLLFATSTCTSCGPDNPTTAQANDRFIAWQTDLR